MKRFEHASAYVQQLRPSPLRALGSLPLLTALAAMLVLSSGAALTVREAVFRGILGALGALGTVLLVKGPPRRADVSIDEEGLHVGGRVAIAREDIASVRIKSARKSTVVVVPRQGAPLALTLASVFQAEEAVVALGRSSLAALRFESAAPSFGRVEAMVEGSAAGAIALAAIGAILAVVSPFLFALAVAAFGVELPLRSAIEIGRDGVLLTGVGRRKFVSFAEVKRVASTVHGAIIFTMRSGEEVVANAGSPERAAFLLKRIERCRQPGTEISESEARRTLLEDHRSFAERLPELRQLGRGGDASYREASVPREQLWRIVEDTGLAASTRVGAAVALSGDLPEPERARLRVVAEGTASPRTRVALEEVAADTVDDERLGEVIGELEAEERARRKATG